MCSHKNKEGRNRGFGYYFERTSIILSICSFVLFVLSIIFPAKFRINKDYDLAIYSFALCKMFLIPSTTQEFCELKFEKKLECVAKICNLVGDLLASILFFSFAILFYFDALSKPKFILLGIGVYVSYGLNSFYILHEQITNKKFYPESIRVRQAFFPITFALITFGLIIIGFLYILGLW